MNQLSTRSLVMFLFACASPALLAQEAKKPDAPAKAEAKAEIAPTASFVLDLTKYAIGDLLLKELGRECIIAEEKDGGTRFIRGRTDDGEVNIPNLALTGTFFAEITLQNFESGFTFALAAKDGTTLPVKLNGSNQLCFGEEKHTISIVASAKQLWKKGERNTLLLQSDGKTIKCLINGEFFATVPYPDKGSWQGIKVSGIRKKTMLSALMVESSKEGKP